MYRGTSHLRGTIQAHLTGAYVTTIFSSWAACITLAIRFASSLGYIAIIDTNLLAPHVTVYHVPDLWKLYPAAGVYTHEYLADYFTLAGMAGRYAGGYLPHNGVLYNDYVYKDLDKRVAAAKRLATIFRPAHDKRPDIIIALTAAFSSLRDLACLLFDAGDGKQLNESLYEKLIVHLSDELEDVKLPPPDSKTPGLVNRKMYVGKYWQLQQLVLLLGAIEDRIRSKCRTELPAPDDSGPTNKALGKGHAKHFTAYST
ncbi:hypothetical protein F5Y05DRAFT_399686 [Hypoxylon sp. FL0543]|nr:hypothetical protein F5Y05DRAFT_399686 [Hypoxylon sp. FL0543]